MNSIDGVTDRHEPAKASGDAVSAGPLAASERSAELEHAIAIQIPITPSVRRIVEPLP
jgi:hypothetical protein